MGKPKRICLLLLLCASFLFAGGLPSAADSTLEETKQLLQKSLTLLELDQEIARLTARESKIGEEMITTETLITENQAKVGETRQHAGKVLRAYYMGERDNLWMLIFSARSISEALTIFEYMNMIIQNDHHALDTYADSYKGLLDAKSKLEAEKVELATVKSAFMAQREKVIAVQKEIDEQLKASENAEALKVEMQKFTEEWKEKGLPLFRSYLGSMSEALPKLLNEDNAGNYMKFTIKEIYFEISDAELTNFFRSQNELFNNMSFKFENDKFMASAIDNGTQVEIEGMFTVENDPNRLMFRVDRLAYNGLVLPDTSNRALEEEFPLGFQPSKYYDGLTVHGITLKDGLLRLEIKL